MKATLVRHHIENKAKNIVTFWFKPDQPMSYIAGQYIEMTIPHPQPDDRGQKHWFTISSSPTDSPLCSITTKFSTPSSSFKQALRLKKIGETVDMSQPMGDFVLPQNDTLPLIFVAGGIGITPYHSIIKYLSDTKQERSISFLYSVRSEQELIFQDLFENYGMNRKIVVSEPAPSWDGLTGQLSGKRIIEITKPKDNALIYVSGPEPMVEALHEQLHDEGISKDRLIGDFFPGYSGV